MSDRHTCCVCHSAVPENYTCTVNGDRVCSNQCINAFFKNVGDRSVPCSVCGRAIVAKKATLVISGNTEAYICSATDCCPRALPENQQSRASDSPPGVHVRGVPDPPPTNRTQNSPPTERTEVQTPPSSRTPLVCYDNHILIDDYGVTRCKIPCLSDTF